ncbi:MAG: DEAD/DEAH box helicase, partial [Candidatus Electrothrix sp. AUS4]|nr:DEAD/DEAH box helicase [Candidatus Electrothrix sp. AUS4]
MLLPDHLPVYKILPQLKTALAEQGCAALTAPPGSGKTTLVPLALQNAPELQGKKILLLEPRRIAARLAAEYMSKLCQEPVGQTVGYQIRFERRISAQTKVEVITEGILCRRLQQDPELSDIGLVIFDEFHERSLDSDLAFTLCLDVLAGLREDLRILVMSATMDAEAVSSLLGNAPIINGEGRIFPVRKEFLPPLPQYASSHTDDLARSTSRAIRQVLTR